jgi:hypothetical protein
MDAMTAADPDSAVNRAVRLVRAFRADEQAQILARLRPEHSGRLRKMLQHNEDSSAGAERTAQERVSAMSADDALRALACCSAQTAALVIAAAQWPWRDEVLRRTPMPRRTTITDRIREGRTTVPAALLNALCESMLSDAQRAQIADRERAAPPRGWRQRMRDLIRAARPGWTR